MTTLIFKPCQCGRAVAHYHWSCHCGKTKITSIVSWWSWSLMLMMITTTSAKIELKKGCSTLRRKLRRDGTTASWCTGGPWTTSILTRRNKKNDLFYPALLGLPKVSMLWKVFALSSSGSRDFKRRLQSVQHCRPRSRLLAAVIVYLASPCTGTNSFVLRGSTSLLLRLIL